MSAPVIALGALWLTPAFVFAGQFLYHLAWKRGYDAACEDYEQDAIDQLHRDLDQFVRESA